MHLARVLFPLVSTHKDISFSGRKLLVVQLADELGFPQGESFVALEADGVGAGSGDLVLLQREGGGCRQMLQDPHAPVNAMVCGIVDQIHLHTTS